MPPQDRRQGTLVYGLDPLVVDASQQLDYLHSYDQDSEFFLGLAAGRLMGSACPVCGYRHATPRAHCLSCGARTRWYQLPSRGTVHSWTVYHGPDGPVQMVLVEFEDAEGLLLARYQGDTPDIGMTVEVRFLRVSRFCVTDMYFVPVSPAPE
ncbi:MAG: Zn-ribbon domain-containing OB-fold protein [Bacillota bacterium]